jgi:hypothetical protein
LPDQWKESIIVPIYKEGDKTDCSNYQGDINSVIGDSSINFIQNFIQYPFLKVKSICMHSSDTGEKMGVHRDSTSVIHRLQESV